MCPITKPSIVIGLFITLFSYTGMASTPPNEGNFSLPSSQHPSPLYSFGQFTIDKNQAQVFLNPSYIAGKEQYFFTMASDLIYGVTDNFAILLSPSLAIKYRQETDESSGLGDTNIRSEYVFFQSSNKDLVAQATIVTGLTVPTGSLDKDPPTGLGSPSFFIGATFNQMYVEWYWFVSPSVQWVKPNKPNHIGSIYSYDAGVGKNLLSQANQYYWFALIEINGLYSEKDKWLGEINPDSGGNIIFISPSIIYATEKLYLQLGISLPTIQLLNGRQDKINYNASALAAWTFN